MKKWQQSLCTVAILGTGVALFWVIGRPARFRAVALAVVDVDARNVQRIPVRREFTYSGKRVTMIIVFFLVHIVLLVGALLGLMGILTFPSEPFPSEQLSGLIGLGALGSVAAFFTACRSAMERVRYVRPWWRRAWRCVYRASQVEALFLMLAGVSVGVGSYLVAYLATLLSSSNAG